MKLLKLKLSNYRRFVGEHEIVFASEENKNVTIIRAQNGSGKTGILMALLFGLFGVIKYDQFQIENEDDIMVSRSLLEIGKTATARVEVEFLESNYKYKIVREVDANNLNGKVSQNNTNIRVKFFKDGIEQNMSKEDIEIFMNNLIGENIRNFLFFDGVRYTELFKKPTRESKKELKKIIEKMLNIDELDKTVQAVRLLKSTLIKDTNDKKIQNDRKDLLNEKVRLLDDKNNIERTIADLERQNLDNQENLNIHEEKVNEYLEHEKSINDLEMFNNEISRINTEIDNIETILKLHSSTNFINNILHSFGNEVREDLRKLASANDANISLVENILHTNKCICCDEPLNEKQKENLTDLLEIMKNKTDGISQKVSIGAESVLHAINNSQNSSGFFDDELKKLELNIERREGIELSKIELMEKYPLIDASI